jgi:exodeoxyribonuclease V gamma subunit
MENLFERYQKALAAWPDKAPHDEELRYHSDATGLDLEDWLRDLRLNAEQQRGRVVLETSDAVKKGKYQRHNLIKHWLVHLAGHLAGEPMSTLIVSKAGDVRFAPLDSDDARAQIEGLLAAWQEGMARPLPLAVKTAFARLDDLTGGRNNAPGIYEGAYMLTGEVESSPYLQRTWPDFDALTRTGEFDLLTNHLLRPLFEATFAGKTPSKPSASNAGDQA